MNPEIKNLLDAALKARANAFAPYSNFTVGAAVKAANGSVYSGCNVENASYGLTVCAERVAIWKAVSEGIREFAQLVVVADTENLISPCGACRQIIWEFCGDIPVTLVNLQNQFETVSMSELLPKAFGREFLE